jgi:hypothetical protein
MAVAGDFIIGDDGRRRTTDQLELLRRANDGRVAWDSEAPADFTYLYEPDQVLLRSEDSDDFEEAVRANQDLFAGAANRMDDPIRGLARYVLPPRRRGEPLHDVLDVLDEALGSGRVTPNHYVHVTPAGKCCPATEPEETGLEEPWPPVCPDEGRGKGVSVVVVDTGWHPPAATDGRTPWLQGVDGDDELNGPDALANEPQVINLSAGCRSRADRPLLSFEVFWESHLRGKDCVLVAAAGNDSSPAPFWPAAFKWALGVGSLDRDGRVSSFSNYCASADVYALGRNIVNAFPDGTFECNETPNKGDIRVFKTGMARWSGTSFAAPVVAGLIAAEISASGSDASTARDAVLKRALRASDPEVGKIKTLRQPYC